MENKHLHMTHLTRDVLIKSIVADEMRFCKNGFDLVKRTVTNPFLQNVGLGILGGPIGAKFGLTRQIDMFNKARAIKGLLDQFGPIADQTMEDVLEEETGQTTALYKDGGLVTLFTEKR